MTAYYLEETGEVAQHKVFSCNIFTVHSDVLSCNLPILLHDYQTVHSQTPQDASAHHILIIAV